jgi:uncharacterized tellurite resistance protein B-like protein
MIAAINRLFNQLGQQSVAQEALTETECHHLCAVLMAEVMVSDGGSSALERGEIQAILEQYFRLGREDVDAILVTAEQEASDATSLFEFTRKINDHFSHEQKSRLVEHLWRVAYADNELDKFEEATIRKVADLIHVPHSVFIQAKLRAKPT